MITVIVIMLVVVVLWHPGSAIHPLSCFRQIIESSQTSVSCSVEWRRSFLPPQGTWSLDEMAHVKWLISLGCPRNCEAGLNTGCGLWLAWSTWGEWCDGSEL